MREGLKNLGQKPVVGFDQMTTQVELQDPRAENLSYYLLLNHRCRSDFVLVVVGGSGEQSTVKTVDRKVARRQDRGK